MTHLLITGASGFIGAHVLALVSWETDLRVTALSRKALDLLGDSTMVRERIAAIGATHLLHLAWYAVPGKYWTAEENFRWVSGTLALAEGFADGGGRRIVAAGTCAEYDWNFGTCIEDVTPTAPATTYGVAKDATRRLLECFSRQRGLTTVWGRVFFPYGPGENTQRLVPSVVRQLLAGGTAAVTEGLQKRDFLHVEDVARAFVALLRSSFEGVVNIGSGQATAVRDVVREIAAELGAPERVAYGALPPRGDEPPLLVADVTRLRRVTGWTPHYDLATGLHDTIEWWKRQSRSEGDVRPE